MSQTCYIFNSPEVQSKQNDSENKTGDKSIWKPATEKVNQNRGCTETKVEKYYIWVPIWGNKNKH